MTHDNNTVSRSKSPDANAEGLQEMRLGTSLPRPAACEIGRDPIEIVTSRMCALCTKSCVTRELGAKLRSAGLRPTRQRLQLAKILFANGDRHFTADMLHEEAMRDRIPVSLATVYNTLQQFTQSGLIRRLALDAPKNWFDTNVSNHHHLFYEEGSAVVDVPSGYLSVSRLPPVPPGMEIAKIEVVVRLRRRESETPSQ